MTLIPFLPFLYQTVMVMMTSMMANAITMTCSPTVAFSILSSSLLTSTAVTAVTAVPFDKLVSYASVAVAIRHIAIKITVTCRRLRSNV